MILKNKNNRGDVGHNILARCDSSAHSVVEKGCYAAIRSSIKITMKKLISLLLILSLSGCAGTVVPNYSPSEIESQKMAFLKTLRVEKGDNSFQAGIFSIKNVQNETVAERGIVSDPISELYLPEGKYLIVLECQDGVEGAMPEMIVYLEQSKSYLLSCQIASTNKAWLTGAEFVASLKGKIEEIEKQHHK